jgi:hypothetical protein
MACEFAVYRCNHEDENGRRCPTILDTRWVVRCERHCGPDVAAIIERDSEEYCKIHREPKKKNRWWRFRRGENEGGKKTGSRE